MEVSKLYILQAAERLVKTIDRSTSLNSSHKSYIQNIYFSSNSDVLGLIQICIITFSDSPPVFARPPPQQQLPPVPVPPMPHQSPYGGGPAQPVYPPQVAAVPSYPPVNTPYPPSGGGPPATGYPPYPSNSQTPYPPIPPAAAYPPAPPGQYPPPYPSQGSNQQQNTANTGTITQEHIKVITC